MPNRSTHNGQAARLLLGAAQSAAHVLGRCANSGREHDLVELAESAARKVEQIQPSEAVRRAESFRRLEHAVHVEVERARAPVDVAHLVRNNIYVYGIRGEGKSGTHRAAAFMEQKRFDATLIHTHTFMMDELPEAIRYAKDRVEDAIKVVVKNDFANASRVAAE